MRVLKYKANGYCKDQLKDKTLHMQIVKSRPLNCNQVQPEPVLIFHWPVW